jgi:hypothetical protein
MSRAGVDWLSWGWQIEMNKLKNTLQTLGMISMAQLQSGELTNFFDEFDNRGMVDYKQFADKVTGLV